LFLFQDADISQVADGNVADVIDKSIHADLPVVPGETRVVSTEEKG